MRSQEDLHVHASVHACTMQSRQASQPPRSARGHRESTTNSSESNQTKLHQTNSCLARSEAHGHRHTTSNRRRQSELEIHAWMLTPAPQYFKCPWNSCVNCAEETPGAWLGRKWGVPPCQNSSFRNSNLRIFSAAVPWWARHIRQALGANRLEAVKLARLPSGDQHDFGS